MFYKYNILDNYNLKFHHYIHFVSLHGQKWLGKKF
jgi:hypothetical protein